MHVTMFKKNYYVPNKITCYFGENREYMKIKNYKYHEGIDFSGMNNTLLIIWNLFSGVILREAYNNIYGNFIELKHNPKYIGGQDEIFLSRYAHLNKFEKGLSNHLIEYGTKLGIMGNTGNSFGIHLHLDIRQKNVKEGKKTNLLLDMQEKLNFKDDEYCFNWQFGNLYINPLLMIQYFEYLQKEQSK